MKIAHLLPRSAVDFHRRPGWTIVNLKALNDSLPVALMGASLTGGRMEPRLVGGKERSDVSEGEVGG